MVMGVSPVKIEGQRESQKDKKNVKLVVIIQAADILTFRIDGKSMAQTVRLNIKLTFY